MRTAISLLFVVTAAFTLDGVASPNTVPAAAGPIETTSVASWSERTLTIVTVVPPSETGAGAQTRRTVRFTDDGTLRVEAPWGAGGAMIGSVYSRVR